MKPDTRQCPVCKKAPPNDQAWRDYDAHVKACAAAFYEKDREKSMASVADRLRKMILGEQ